MYFEDLYREGSHQYLHINDIDWEMMLYTFNEYPPHFCEEYEIRGKNGGKSIEIDKCYSC